jgi:4-hydroxy-4-methyl-2-oxoglutarate aldolase
VSRDGASVSPSLLEELAGYGTATLHEAAGGIGALPGSIAPLDPTCVVWGRALTVWSPPGDNLALHRAVAVAQPGDVLVVDHGGSLDYGPFGDILAWAAIQRGVAGLVIDGAVRDSASLIKMRFPVFARGRSIRGTIKCNPGLVGQALLIGQVTVHTGDLVFGDADGAVVLPPDELETLRDAAASRIRVEACLRDEILKGRMTLDLLNLRHPADESKPG